MDHLGKGSLFILLAALAYAGMGVLVKLGGDGLTDEQLVFMRNAVCLVILLPFLRVPLKTKVLKMHLIRAGAGLLNMYCFFISIRYILLADAMVLNNTMPLFIPLVMWVWKREKIPLPLVPGLVLGFLGVVLILRPSVNLFQPASLLALASGIFMSISMAGIRLMTFVEPIARILFYYFSITTAISAIPLMWGWNAPTPLLWGILVGVGICAALYQWALTKGYQLASAARVSPLIYMAVILSGLFDWLIWHKIPTWMTVVGIALVISGAIWCLTAEEHA